MRTVTDKKRTDCGYRLAKAITKRHAKTFYFASLFLPKEKRLAAYAVYAICRITDDSVDNPIGGRTTEEIVSIRNKIESAYSDHNLNEPLLLAFRETVLKHSIPRKYFEELIQGMIMDTGINRYPTFAQLYTYCYRVAGVIGLVMLNIFGYNDAKSERQAVDLGIAMQLTNIIRDIKEDYQRGRIYIPLDKMKEFGITEKDIANGVIDGKMKLLLADLINQARGYYRSCIPGIKKIRSWRCRLVVTIMGDLYLRILTVVEDNQYDVFSKRAQLNNMSKIIITIRILLKGEYR